MTPPATRLITLIMLLQRKPNQKAAELAEALGISVRTLHRYFAMLDEMGIPIYTERGPHGGFSLVRGYRMPPLVLTPEEATAVYLGTSMVEVGGDAVVLVDPTDHDAVAGALDALLDDPAEAARLGAAARVRAETFTWERTAEQVATALHEVIS